MALPTSGVLGQWGFDDGSGTTVTDYSGNGNHGTIMGTGATWTAKGLQTTLDSYVQIPHLDFYTGKQFTFIVACKYALAKTYPSLMGSYDEILVYLNNNASYRTFCVQNDSGADNVVGAVGSLAANTLQVVAVTYNNSSYVTYLDGTQNRQVNGLPNQVADGSDPFYFSDPDGSTYRDNYTFYYGLAYNRALTAQEVADAYAYIQSELAAPELKTQGTGGASVTPAGTLSRQALFTEGAGEANIAPTGGTVKLIGTVTGSAILTPGGAVNKHSHKAAGGAAVAPAGNGSTLFLSSINAGGATLTPAKGLSKTVIKFVGNAIVVPSGVIARGISKTVGQALVSPTGYAVKTLYQAVGAAIVSMFGNLVSGEPPPLPTWLHKRLRSMFRSLKNDAIDK